MGTIVLSHWSAIGYWRDPRCESAATKGCSATRAATVLSDACGDRASIAEALIRNPVLQDLPAPLHLLADTSARARRTYDLQVHCRTAPLASGSLVQVATGVYACSPELAFIQVCQKLPLIEAALLGCELCGTYRTGSSLRAISRPFDPATTRAELLGFCCSTRGAHGTRRARAAARLVVDDAPSPLVARLMLYLTMPKLHGGEAFPKPLLDCVFDVPADLQSALDVETVGAAAYWPATRTVLAIEPGLGVIEKTVAFERLGMHVVWAHATPTPNDEQLDALVSRLHALMGRDVRHQDNPRRYWERRAALRHELFGKGGEPL